MTKKELIKRVKEIREELVSIMTEYYSDKNEKTIYKNSKGEEQETTFHIDITAFAPEKGREKGTSWILTTDENLSELEDK